MTTVQPVGRSGNVYCPTVMPGTVAIDARLGAVGDGVCARLWDAAVAMMVTAAINAPIASDFKDDTARLYRRSRNVSNRPVTIHSH
jgi:hypothetical protein